MKAFILLVTPIYPPVPGGGSQYSEFLAKNLPKLDSVRSLEILTEYFPGESKIEENESGALIVKRRLAQFASLPGRFRRRYLNFVIQNMQLAWFLFSWHMRMRRMNHDKKIVILHGAYFIHPSLLGFMTYVLKHLNGNDLKLILDLRDPSAPLGRLRKLHYFDLVITCGRRLTDRMQGIEGFSVPIEEIPVPMEEIIISEEDVSSLLNRYSLRNRAYLLTPNGVNDAKGFSVLFDAWRILVDKGDSIDLVVAGHTKDWKDSYEKYLAGKPRLINLGPLSNRDVRVLMKGAAAVVNPSQVESLSRVCLESMMVGTPVLLPPNVPEFEKLDQKFIAKSQDPERLAMQIDSLIYDREVPLYDIKMHEVLEVRRLYGKVISQLLVN